MRERERERVPETAGGVLAAAAAAAEADGWRMAAMGGEYYKRDQRCWSSWAPTFRFRVVSTKQLGVGRSESDGELVIF